MSKRPVIWIVDDSPVEARITEQALGPSYVCEYFSDAHVVAERLAASSVQPTLVVSDWVMPGMTGEELCQFVRSLPSTRQLPFILLTGTRREPRDVVSALAVGANDYLPRPFAPAELRARVDAAIRVRSASALAEKERARLASVNELGRALFHAGSSVPGIIETLARIVTTQLCDGCAIMLLPGDVPAVFVSRHRREASGETLALIAAVADPAVHAFGSDDEACRALPPVYHAYIARFGLRGLAILPLPVLGPVQGVITATRDGASEPFEDQDITTLQTSIEYTALAVQNALRFDVERTAREQLEVIASERQQTASFYQQLIGIVGHDLRNPLAAFTTGMELLRARTHDPMLLSTVDRLGTGIRRMTRIVDQLLDVTRARMDGGIPIVRRRADLLAVVEDAAEQLGAVHRDVRIEWRRREHVVGHWDPERLDQVFSNLLTNAVRYGKAGGAVILEVFQSGTNAVASVTNEVRNEPITPEALSALFEPYRRGETSRHDSAGLGLGLYIVREVVRAHGGQVTARSDAGGTEFRVALPLAAGAAS